MDQTIQDKHKEQLQKEWGQQFDSFIGYNQLHKSVCRNNFDDVKYLIEAGYVDVNCPSKFGETALDIAHQNKNQEMMDLLISFGGKRSEESLKYEEDLAKGMANLRIDRALKLLMERMKTSEEQPEERKGLLNSDEMRNIEFPFQDKSHLPESFINSVDWIGLNWGDLVIEYEDGKMEIVRCTEKLNAREVLEEKMKQITGKSPKYSILHELVEQYIKTTGSTNARWVTRDWACTLRGTVEVDTRGQMSLF